MYKIRVSFKGPRFQRGSLVYIQPSFITDVDATINHEQRSLAALPDENVLVLHDTLDESEESGDGAKRNGKRAKLRHPRSKSKTRRRGRLPQLVDALPGPSTDTTNSIQTEILPTPTDKRRKLEENSREHNPTHQENGGTHFGPRTTSTITKHEPTIIEQD